MFRMVWFMAGALALGCSSFSIPEDLKEAQRFRLTPEDPHLLTAVFEQRLDDLGVIGAEPGRVLALSEFFFENYPFTGRDRILDEQLIFKVAEAHSAASRKLKPATEACDRIKKTQTLDGVISILEAAANRHDDGDRCTWEMIVRLGNEWNGISAESAWRLWEILRAQVGSSPLIVPLAMRINGIIARSTRSQLPTWEALRDAFVPGRWKRTYLCFRMHESQYLDQGLMSPAVLEFAKEFASSKLDRDLAEHGIQLLVLLRALGRLRNGNRDAVTDACAADEWIQSHPGGFLLNQEVRLATVSALLEVREVDRAKSKADYDGDQELATSRHSRVGSQKAVELAAVLLPGQATRTEGVIDRVMQLNAKGTPETGEALHILASTHQLMGREKAMIACLHAMDAVAAEDDSELRSQAGRWLGRYYATRKEWNKAMAAWTGWKPFDWCGTCRHDMETQREKMIEYCKAASR